MKKSVQEFEDLEKRKEELRSHIQQLDKKTLRMEYEYTRTIQEFEKKFSQNNWNLNDKLFQHYNEITDKLNIIKRKVSCLLNTQEIDILKGYNESFNDLIDDLNQTKQFYSKNMADARSKELSMLKTRYQKEERAFKLLNQNKKLLEDNQILKMDIEEIEKELIRRKSDLESIKYPKTTRTVRKVDPVASPPSPVKEPVPSITEFQPINQMKSEIRAVKNQQFLLKYKIKEEMEVKHLIRTAIINNNSLDNEKRQLILSKILNGRKVQAKHKNSARSVEKSINQIQDVYNRLETALFKSIKQPF